MSKYISEEELLKALASECKYPLPSCNDCRTPCDLYTIICHQKDIVRCKDCHYGIRNSKEDIFCIKAIYNDKYKRPNWFCADGERE